MKPKKFTACVFLFVTVAFMFSAVYTFASRKVLHMMNPEEEHKEITIDWKALYPFESGSGSGEPVRKASLPERLYEYLKNKCEEYSSKSLPGYYRLVESARKYEDIIDWNMASIFSYNAVVKLKDGYLTTYVESRDVTPNAEATIGLAEFCRSRGIEFMYLNFPTKVCVSEDADVSGMLDFANQNADRFLAMLDDAGVHNYDFRRMLHEDGMNHHAAFYVTDHHWKAETGLWAARHILELLRDAWGWDVKPEILDPENFEYVIYPDWFLGSRGRKVTLARTNPDDFTLIYPKYKTLVNIEIPDLCLNESGDFSVVYNMANLDEKNYYTKDPYAAYGYGTRHMVKINNMLFGEDKNLFVIRDSFSDTVIPFLAMGIKNIEAVDLRYLAGGSVRKYIDLKKPDAVIVMYYTGRFAQPGLGNSDKNLAKFYDFR